LSCDKSFDSLFKDGDLFKKFYLCLSVERKAELELMGEIIKFKSTTQKTDIKKHGRIIYKKYLAYNHSSPPRVDLSKFKLNSSLYNENIVKTMYDVVLERISPMIRAIFILFASYKQKRKLLVVGLEDRFSEIIEDNNIYQCFLLYLIERKYEIYLLLYTELNSILSKRNDSTSLQRYTMHIANRYFGYGTPTRTALLVLGKPVEQLFQAIANGKFSERIFQRIKTEITINLQTFYAGFIKEMRLKARSSSMTTLDTYSNAELIKKKKSFKSKFKTYKKRPKSFLLQKVDAIRNLKITNIITNYPNIYKPFGEYLITDHSEVYLEFYKEISIYKHLSDPEEITKKCLRMVKQYLGLDEKGDIKDDNKLALQSIHLIRKGLKAEYENKNDDKIFITEDFFNPLTDELVSQLEQKYHEFCNEMKNNVQKYYEVLDEIGEVEIGD